MKKCTFTVLNYRLPRLVIILIFCLFFNCTYKSINKPETLKNYVTKIQWNQKTIDFGKVKNDTTIIGDYWLYNLDTLPLFIEYVNPECGCTNFNVSKKIILPNDSCLIRLFLNTKNKKGYQRIITTVCTNSKQKFSKLTLKGLVK